MIRNADAASILVINGDVDFRADHADPSRGIYVQKSISNGKTPTQMHAADRNSSSTESPSKDNDNR
jgi:hypothetical protein